MAALVPVAIAVGQGIYSHYANKKAQAASTAQMQEALATARQSREQGASLFDTGSPLLKSASGYWQKLLSGDKTALEEATAPERQSITETYTGAERGLAAGPLRGGARDYAAAELARSKAGQLGGLVPNARRAAATEGANLGLSTASAGANATAASGGLFTSLYGDQERRREFDIGQNNATGEETGKLISNLLAGLVKGNTAGTANTSPIKIGSPTVGSTGSPGLIAGRTPGYATSGFAGMRL